MQNELISSTTWNTIVFVCTRFAYRANAFIIGLECAHRFERLSYRFRRVLHHGEFPSLRGGRICAEKNIVGKEKRDSCFFSFLFLSWKQEWRNEVCSWLNDFKNFKCFVYVNYYRHIVGRFERCEKMMMETRSDEGNVGSPRVWLNN